MVKDKEYSAGKKPLLPPASTREHQREDDADWVGNKLTSHVQLY